MLFDLLIKLLLPLGLLAWLGNIGFNEWLEPIVRDVPPHVFHLAGWTWCIWFVWHLLQKLSR